jgi:hypothetical protein
MKQGAHTMSAPHFDILLRSEHSDGHAGMSGGAP